MIIMLHGVEIAVNCILVRCLKLRMNKQLLFMHILFIVKPIVKEINGFVYLQKYSLNISFVLYIWRSVILIKDSTDIICLSNSP